MMNGPESMGMMPNDPKKESNGCLVALLLPAVAAFIMAIWSWAEAAPVPPVPFNKYCQACHKLPDVADRWVPPAMYEYAGLLGASPAEIEEIRQWITEQQ